MYGNVRTTSLEGGPIVSFARYFFTMARRVLFQLIMSLVLIVGDQGSEVQGVPCNEPTFPFFGRTAVARVVLMSGLSTSVKYRAPLGPCLRFFVLVLGLGYLFVH